MDRDTEREAYLALFQKIREGVRGIVDRSPKFEDAIRASLHVLVAETAMNGSHFSEDDVVRIVLAWTSDRILKTPSLSTPALVSSTLADPSANTGGSHQPTPNIVQRDSAKSLARSSPPQTPTRRDNSNRGSKDIYEITGGLFTPYGRHNAGKKRKATDNGALPS